LTKALAIYQRNGKEEDGRVAEGIAEVHRNMGRQRTVDASLGPVIETSSSCLVPFGMMRNTLNHPSGRYTFGGQYI
jgi:hypothetical protein